MTSRNIFPGIGLAVPSTCMGPVLDNITVSDITVTNLLTANNVNVTGTITIQNIIESLIIKTDILEEFTPGAGVTINDVLYLTNPSLLASYDVYDTSGTTLRGSVSLRGSSTAYDAALRMTNGPSGAFIFEGATTPYMTLYNDAGVGKMLVDRIAPNASTTVSIDSLVVGYSTAITPGGLRYNSNVLEVCNNLGVWGPTFTAGGSIDITNRIISLAATISATNATFTNLYGDALLGVTAERLVISPTSVLLPGAMRYNAGTMQFSDGTIWKTFASDVYTAGNSITVSGANVISLNGDVFIDSIRGLTTPNTTFISLTSADATVPHTPLQYYASARVGDTARLIFGRGGGTYDSAVIKHNYVGASDTSNSIRMGVVGMDDVFVGYGGGYSSIRQPTIIGAGATIEGNLGYSGGNLSVYAGGSRKNVALIDPTSNAVISDGIITTNNDVTFYPTDVAATDMRYIFSNIINDIGGQTFMIAPWATDGSVYVSTYSPSFVYRSRINGIDATPWASSIGVGGVSGVRHDYVAIGETIATTPVKGSFATDANGLMKSYNGTAWKFLVPMDGTTRMAEANGIVTSASPAYFYPTSAVNTDQDYIFSNVNGGGGQNYVISTRSTGDVAYLTSNTASFAHRARINNAPETAWAITEGTNGVSGVRHNYMVVGSATATTPVLGSFATDVATTSLKYHDGSAWRFLTSQSSTGMIYGDGLISTANPVSFEPTSIVAIDNAFAFRNIAGSGGQTFWIEPRSSLDMVYVTTDAENFEYRGTINGTYPMTWASSAGISGVNGVRFDYMVVGSGLATTPILGSLTTNVASNSLRYYNGATWKQLVGMDPVTKMVEADGMVSGSPEVRFYPTSLTKINSDYVFSNINGIVGGQKYTIGVWESADIVYLTTSSANFTHRATINGNPAYSWVSSLGTNGNEGVMYDYMVVGPNLGTVPVLGALTTDTASSSLRFYNGAAWKQLVGMDAVTRLAEANGMVSASGSMAFRPTSVTALDSRYIFHNINGAGGQSYAIDPWAADNSVYLTTYSNNFVYRGKINNTDSTVWMSSAGVNGASGVRHDYTLIGQTLATTPLLGSFASDTTDSVMKYYNGAMWKYMTPMSTTTKMAECTGIISSTNIINFYPVTNDDTRYIFANASTSGQSYAIDPWAADNSVYLTSYSDNFIFRGKINNTESTVWMSSAGTNGASGVRHDYTLIGQTLATTPLLGSFASDATDNVMKYHNGAEWKYLTPMSTGTRRGEMQGITMTNANFEMRPTASADTTLSIGNDTTSGSNGFEVQVNTSDHTSIRTKKTTASYEHTIGGVLDIPWITLNDSGASAQFLMLTNTFASPPIAGAIRFDGTSMLVYNGVQWSAIPTFATLPAVHYGVWATISCGMSGGVPNHSLIDASNSPTFPYTNTPGVVGVDWIALPAGYSWYFTVTIEQMATGTQSNLRFKVVQGGYYAQIYPNIEGVNTTWAAVTSGQIIISVVGTVYRP